MLVTLDVLQGSASTAEASGLGFDFLFGAQL